VDAFDAFPAAPSRLVSELAHQLGKAGMRKPPYLLPAIRCFGCGIIARCRALG
jgi:hypothetical protein